MAYIFKDLRITVNIGLIPTDSSVFSMINRPCSAHMQILQFYYIKKLKFSFFRDCRYIN